MSADSPFTRLRGPLEYAARDNYKNLSRVKELGLSLVRMANGHPALAEFSLRAQALDQLEGEAKAQVVAELMAMLQQILDRQATGTSARPAPVASREQPSREERARDEPPHPALKLSFAPRGGPGSFTAEGAESAERGKGFSKATSREVAERGKGVSKATSREVAAPVTESKPRPAPAARAKLTLDPARIPLSALKGVGDKLTESFALRNLVSVSDLLLFLPRRYEDRRKQVSIRDAQIGDRVTLRGTIRVLGAVPMRGGRKSFEMAIGDGSGFMTLKWFNFRMQHMQGRYAAGQTVAASGVVDLYQGQKQILHPDLVILSESGDMGDMPLVIPHYLEVQGVHEKKLFTLVDQALAYVEQMPDAFASLSFDRHMPSLRDALRTLHQPTTQADIDGLNTGRSPAHERLIMEELLVLQLGLRKRRLGVVRESASVLKVVDPAGLVKELFPFTLTNAQNRVLADILRDLSSGHPMHRLVQGDVGSGKTAVAFSAAVAAARAGRQVAMMAPTELLAEQHFHNAVKWLHPRGIRVGFLSGSQRASEAKRTLGLLAEGAIDLLIGTHSLIEDRVVFRRLGLAIVDEQHRFGVMQRASLRRKGTAEEAPHLLVMTATPIPRTLALTLYGDLDVSIIDELPPGRTPIKTELVREAQRGALYSKVKQQLALGRQAYVVLPLVEESEKIDLRDATRMADELVPVLAPYQIALLHGRMSGEEKDAVMKRFASGEVQVLVSTTVIEVGIDVPNSTVMVIEHAERFGLSQLHQLRGRVGRGAHQSYCYLVASGFVSQEAYQRLSVMTRTNDGFIIAEEDLAIRGPGDFIGTRQAGLPELGVANLVRDQDLLSEAQKLADTLLTRDPDLAFAPVLAALVKQRFPAVSSVTLAG